MLRTRRVCVCLAILAVMLPSASMCQGVIRGIVVDTTAKILWLGFPVPVTKGSVFDVKLMPGGKAIARAEVIDATPDAPYVAKATFKILDKTAMIPIGAYVEQSAIEANDRDEAPVLKPREMSHRGANPLGLQVGAFFPMNDRLRDEMDDVWPSLELDYMCHKVSRGEIYVGLGYLGGRGNSVEKIGGTPTAVGRTISVYPLTVNGKFPLGEGCHKSWFGRLGIGAYYVNDKKTIEDVSNLSHKTRVGWQAGLGYESKNGQTAQLSYLDVPDTDVRGITFSLGTRF